MQTSIMVIEINSTIRNFLTDYLRENVPDVVVFPTESEEMALSMLQIFSPDIITICYVTDPINRRGNGLTLAQKIRHQFNYRKKIIMISGTGDFVRGDPGAECIDFFVGKPIDIKKLNEALET